ncbi:hypothetical protein F2P56_021410 [Juglans regia]|uniref:Reverse transcriptase zinc-binding domain-containing protein n=1 Tax=Juglans regia TaxID=51240 RepID=A0A833X2S3_JUGRE|nr:hypothetical protein F2P56_027848 [Juglans regia]KAF5457297.1 hypothetical protein F2P56_021410 [Juglans regia]
MGLWKHIRRGWVVFHRHTRLQLGTGSKIGFWKDAWCNNSVLQDLFPSLFLIASTKDATVAEVMEVSGGNIHWNINFNRAAQDWEMESFVDFYSLLYSIRPNIQQEDGLWWCPARNGVFSVRSFYKVLTQVSEIQFPWKKLWRHKAPPKASFFVWTASLGKILTTDNLRKRRIIIADWCCMCKSGGESVNHLLLHCEIARTLWDEVFKKMELMWVMPQTVLEVLACWASIHGVRQIKAVWKMIPICIMWCLWQERNERTFEDKERTLEELKMFFFRTLCTWAIAIDFNGMDLHVFLVSNMPT